ncbi:MAG: SDR family NAD(P)-dependent oxidoreductase [Nostoc sp. ChiSLP02]|nr:SDR family NAD(P)-dependent oxidoreductase [Nostoc sp. DedSLP05]MDZ8102842.1 SDR family NAD(P)-dependent oxidoreductase [Nostoc sp. DedSLP01]MDZ8184147.1 SDR family NAD(P)-dependent oxidoreductase [Nostoc sp. ChiSLP02]
MTTITGKTVLLTGASRGIGVFIARALAKEQATIIGVGRSHQQLEAVAAEIKALGCNFIPITCDISNLQELPILIEKIHQLVPAIDILINNAGIEIYKAFTDYSTADIQSVISTNLLAAMELSRLLLPNMLAQKSGHIVNIASLAAKKGHPYDSIYSASKAGLFMWGDALRQELVGTGVQISTICPGYIAEQGMLADTGIPAPSLSGTSKPEAVAKAVIQAIESDRVEVIVNKDFLTVWLTKLLFAIWQFYPQLGDLIYRQIGVTELNKKRCQQIPQKFKYLQNDFIKSS